jgi:hypothetical protein
MNTHDTMRLALDALVKSQDCIQRMTDGPHKAAWGEQLDVNDHAIAALTAALAEPSKPLGFQVRRAIKAEDELQTLRESLSSLIMPPSKGQSPVLFEDGYAEGWSKCHATVLELLK